MSSVDVTATTLEPYLKRQFDASEVTVENITKHSAGWSRGTYSFDIHWWTEDRENTDRLVLRHESEEGLLDTDLKKEYTVIDEIQGTGVPVPETYWYEGDQSVIGERFFLVEHVSGDAPNTFRPDEREMLEQAWEERTLARDFVETIANIHAVEPDQIPYLDSPQKDELIEREVGYWEAKYREVALREEPIIDEAIRWFRANPPPVRDLTLVHGDFRIGNLLVDDDEITAVLDWEQARISDPMLDLGYSSMQYPAGKLIDPPTDLVCGLLEADWYYRKYEDLTGRTVDQYTIDYWTAFSIFMMITILLTGLDDFHSGESGEPGHAWLHYPLPSLFEDLIDVLQTRIDGS